MERYLLLIALVLCHCATLSQSSTGSTTPSSVRTNRPKVTFRPRGTLPPALSSSTSKLGDSNMDSFRSSLSDATEQSIFDRARSGSSSFNLVGMRPRDVVSGIAMMKELSSGIKNMLLSGDFQNLTLSDMGMIPASLLGAIKPSSMKQMSAALDDAEILGLCKNFFDSKESGARLFKFLDNFNCVRALNHTAVTIANLTTIERDQMVIVAEVIRRTKQDVTTWTEKEAAAVYMVGLKANEIRRLPDNTYRQLADMDLFVKRPPRLPNDAVLAMCDKVREIVSSNDWAQLTKAVAAKIKGVLGECKDAIKSLPANLIADVADDLKDQIANLPRSMVKEMARKLGDTSTWSVEDAKKRFPFILDNANAMKRLQDNVVKGLVDDPNSFDIMKGLNKKQSQILGKRLRNIAEFKDASNLDAPTLKKFPANILATIPASYLKRIPCSAIAGAIAELSAVIFKFKAQSKVIYERCKAELGLNDASSASSSSLKALGSGLAAFDKSDFDKMSASALAGAKDVLKNIDFPMSSCRAILKKIKASNGNSLSGHCGELGNLRKCVKQSDLSSCGSSDLGLNDASATPDVTGMSHAQLKSIFKTFVTEQGEIDGGSSMFTATNMVRLAKVLAPGMTKSIAAKINVDSECPGALEALGSEEDSIDTPVRVQLAEKAKEYIQSVGSSNIDDTTAFQLSIILKNLKKIYEEIESLISSPTQIKAIVDAISSTSIKHITAAEARELFQLYLKYRTNSGDSSSTVDMRNSASFSKDVVSDAANYVAGINEADIDKLDNDAINDPDIINGICKAVMPHLSKARFMNRLRGIADFFTNTTKLVMAGGCAAHMTQDDVNKISDTDAESVCTDLMADMEVEETGQKERDDAGYKDDMTSEQRTARRDGKNRAVQKCLPAIQANSQSSSRRRKRATTTTLTCDDLTNLGSAATGVTAEQLSTLTASEFEACIESMNSYNDWSADRRTAFFNLAKSAWGNTVSAWTPEQIRLGGSIVVSGLTDTEIGTLNLTTIESASAAAQTNYFKGAQLASLFSRYLSANNMQASSVTSDDLTSFGNLACGATNTHIASFTSSAYSDAASAVGALTSCEAAQLEAYYAHATTAFGALSGWGTDVISTVGTVVGGSGEDIKQLTSDQIGAMTTNTISAIPASTLAKMTTAQLAEFSPAQANAVTSSQQNALSAEQLNILVSAGASVKTSTAPKMSQISILLMVAAYLFTKL